MKTTKTILLAFAFLVCYAIGYSQTISPEFIKALDEIALSLKRKYGTVSSKTGVMVYARQNMENYIGRITYGSLLKLMYPNVYQKRKYEKSQRLQQG